MSMEKYQMLIALLTKRTEAGTAAWETTVDEGVYALSLSDFSVRISAEKPRESYSYEEDDIVFRIVNSDGQVVDSFRDVDIAQEFSESDRVAFFRRTANLHKQARRQALGADYALDRLIDELRKP